MRKTRLILSVLALISGLMMGGCYQYEDISYSDTDIVITKHNPDYDFTPKGTYALPDKIVKVTGNLVEGDDPEFINQTYADQMLDRMATNMSSLGYTRVDISADPDLVMVCAAWDATTIVYYYDYWYWWWGGYYPYWGYPPVYATSYTTGTLVMSIFDPEVLTTDGKPINQWTGACNGLLSNSYDLGRVNSAIDRAFSQSQYLKTN